MAQEKNLSQIGQGWLDVFEERLKQALADKKVGVTGTLAASFVKSIVYQANGDPAKLELSFLFYGRFVDMGVGRGSKIGQQHQQNLEKRAGIRAVARRPKKWYSKTATREVAILRHLLFQMYGINIVNAVESSLDDLELQINI